MNIKHRKNRMLRTKSSAFLNNICQWNKRDAYTLDTVTYLGSLLVFSVIEGES